jgi:hypothetical protein
LHVVIAQHAREGVPQEELQPLNHLETGIDALKAQA